MDAIVEGSISQADGHVRINLQLVRAETDTHIWAHAYEGELEHLSRLQGHLVQELAAQLYSTSSPPAQKSIQFDSTTGAETSPDSHNSYLYGMYYSNKLSREGLEKGISYFEHAISSDPKNKLAYAALGESVFVDVRPFILASEKGLPLGQKRCSQSLETR